MFLFQKKIHSQGTSQHTGEQTQYIDHQRYALQQHAEPHRALRHAPQPESGLEPHQRAGRLRHQPRAGHRGAARLAALLRPRSRCQIPPRIALGPHPQHPQPQRGHQRLQQPKLAGLGRQNQPVPPARPAERPPIFERSGASQQGQERLAAQSSAASTTSGTG